MEFSLPRSANFEFYSLNEYNSYDFGYSFISKGNITFTFDEAVNHLNI